MRVSLFGACFFVCLLLAHFKLLPVMAGASGVLLLLIIALAVSGLLSYVLLSKQRDALSAQISGAVEQRRAAGAGMKQRIAAQTAAEDALDDAVRSEQGSV
jgi:C4-dicarboxylate-specific signal transduction histidine kinase